MALESGFQHSRWVKLAARHLGVEFALLDTLFKSVGWL
jgi:hypothetical protein